VRGALHRIRHRLNIGLREDTDPLNQMPGKCPLDQEFGGFAFLDRSRDPIPGPLACLNGIPIYVNQSGDIRAILKVVGARIKLGGAGVEAAVVRPCDQRVAVVN